MRTTYVNTTALTAVGIQSAYSEVRHDPKKSWDLPRIIVRSQCQSSQHLSHVVGWVIHTSVGTWLHTQCIMLSSFHSPLVCSQFKMSSPKVYPGFRFMHVYLSVNLVVSLSFVLSHHSVSSKICVNGSAFSSGSCKKCRFGAHLPYQPFPTPTCSLQRPCLGDQGQQDHSWPLSTDDDYHAFHWSNQFCCNHKEHCFVRSGKRFTGFEAWVFFINKLE